MRHDIMIEIFYLKHATRRKLQFHAKRPIEIFISFYHLVITQTNHTNLHKIIHLVKINLHVKQFIIANN